MYLRLEPNKLGRIMVVNEEQGVLYGRCTPPAKYLLGPPPDNTAPETPIRTIMSSTDELYTKAILATVRAITRYLSVFEVGTCMHLRRDCHKLSLGNHLGVSAFNS